MDSMGSVGILTLESVVVTYINGMNTTFEQCVGEADMISNFHGRTVVHYLHLPTEGFFADLATAISEIYIGTVAPSVAKLVGLWRERCLIKERIIHYAHSRGALITALAFRLLRPEEKRKFDIRLFGSPVVLRDRLARIQHFLAPLDYVMCVSPYQYMLEFCRGKVRWLSHEKESKWVEHDISERTYKKLLQLLGAEFEARYVRIKAKL